MPKQAKLKDAILDYLNEEIRVLSEIGEISILLKVSYDGCFVACDALVRDDYIETRRVTSSTEYPNNQMIWITSAGKNFLQNNGSYWFDYQVKQIEYDEAARRDEQEGEKLDAETKLVKWQVKTFWWWFWIAVVGGSCGVISLGINLYSIYWQ